MSQPTLTDIAGIGPAIAERLAGLGYPDVQAVANATVDDLTKVPGSGPVSAASVRAAAQDLVRDAAAPPEPRAAAGNKEESGKEKSGKKNKKKSGARARS